MLNLLRKKKITKKILWALAIIIIPAFVLWGAGSLSKRKLPFKYIGTIEGKKIPIDEFIQSLKDVEISLFLNYFNQPQALDKLQKDRKFLNRIAWENLMIKRRAKKEKINTSDEEVINFIRHHPLFVKGGVFNNELYAYILKNSLGIMPRAFEESVRGFLVNGKYKTKIIENVTVSDEEVHGAYKNEFEKARVYYVLIDKKGFKEKVEISESEITSFYEKNKGRFREDEKVILQYIAFPHKEEDSKEDALTGLKAVYEKLKVRPRNMGKIAQQLNLTIKETSPFSQDEIVSEIDGVRDISIVSFRLRPLIDILPVISEEKMGTSYIIRVKEKIPPRIKSRDEVSSYIANMVRDEKTRAFAKDTSYKLYDEATAGNMSLKETAKTYDLELYHTAFISRFDYIEGVGESYKIVDNAFKLKAGVISEPIEIRKGFALIEPGELQFINEEKFEKEKTDYKNKLLGIKKLKALEDWFRNASVNSSLNVDLDRI